MVIIKVSGGLASQLHKYMIGYMISKVLSTELKLDLTWFDNTPKEDTSRDFLLHNYPIEINVASKKEIKSLKPTRIGKFVNRFLPIKSQNYSGESFFDKKHIEKLSAPVYVEGEWFGDELISDYLCEFKRMFRCERDLKSNLGRKKVATLHVRRGDFYSNDNARKLHGVVGESYYISAMKLADSMGVDKFLVFSDDVEWVRSNYFKNVSFDLEFCDVDDCITEFEEMKVHNVNITSNSGFSWLSAWLGDSDYIISPKTWVSDEAVNCRILKNMTDKRMIFI
ncbi:TPA: alpha-1,2-fucosyltransferase [Vibrio harveyi]|uniref:alpha-1,2-fucosyltransferase n=1 Tax=Vibrio parahaemolyticus TaxID=670 RepID=UPI00226BB828|nr:alpha-1,2-fucosyltransferase [Vibrio parahaemolyticus]MCX8773893.1 alpha-1,2-fucosyltransferase [Vibrio parahaemolyticus]HDM8164137.1 alpha-1,2-fucosyltransferase [Vibrio harveyi]